MILRDIYIYHFKLKHTHTHTHTYIHISVYVGVLRMDKWNVWKINVLHHLHS